jgi:hypothetical protein
MKPNPYILRPDNARARMKAAWDNACELLQHGLDVLVQVGEFKPTRTLEQNAKMWAMLGDISEQIQWPVDGAMKYITPEDWKDILTAGLKKTQRVAQGIEGGFVMLGERTSKMNIGEMIEMIEFMHWFGAREETRVHWSNEVGEQIKAARAA